MGGNAISTLASFLRNIIIARLVSVEDFGIAALFAMTMSVVEMASNLAIDRLIVQSQNGDDPRFQATGQAFQVFRGFLGALILYAAATYVAAFFKVPQATWAFQWLALVPLVRGFIHLDMARCQREMQFAPSVWFDAIPQLVTVILAAPLAMWLGDFSVMVWLIIVQAFVAVMVSHSQASRPYRWAWDAGFIAQFFSFGWPLLINGVLMLVIFQADKAIVGAAFSMEALGWYSAAFAIALAPASIISKVLGPLLLPVLSRIQTTPGQFHEKHLVALHGSLLLGLLVAQIFIYLGSDFYLTVFGDKYRDGVAVVVWLGIMQAVRIAKVGPSVVAMAHGESKNPMFSNLVRGSALPISLLVVWLGYAFHTIAIVALVGEVAAYTASLVLLKTRLGYSIAVLAMPALLCSLLPGLALLSSVYFLVDSSLYVRLASCLTALVLSLALCWGIMPQLARTVQRNLGASFT